MEKNIEEKWNKTTRDEKAIINRRIYCILETAFTTELSYTRQFFLNNYWYQLDCLQGEEKEFFDEEIEKKINKTKEKYNNIQKSIEKLQDVIKRHPDDILAREKLEKKKIKLSENKKKYKRLLQRYKDETDPKGELKFTEADKNFFDKIEEMFGIREDYEKIKRDQWELFEKNDRIELFNIIEKILTEDGRWKTPNPIGFWPGYHWAKLYGSQLEMVKEKIFMPHVYRIKKESLNLIGDLGAEKDVRKYYRFEEELDDYIETIKRIASMDKFYLKERIADKIEEMLDMLENISFMGKMELEVEYSNSCERLEKLMKNIEGGNQSKKDKNQRKEEDGLSIEEEVNQYLLCKEMYQARKRYWALKKRKKVLNGIGNIEKRKPRRYSKLKQYSALERYSMLRYEEIRKYKRLKKNKL